MKAYTIKKEKVLQKLNVNGEKGLASEQVAKNSKQYGKNEFTKAEKITIFKRILDAIKEPMLLMLIFAGVIATRS